MLIKLFPEQVEQAWSLLKPVIEGALPPTVRNNDTAMTNILMAIALEKAQLWVYYNEKKQYRPEVVVVTTIIVEPLALNRALLIYAMATIGTITREVWESGMETLGRFAYGNDCSHVIAYSANDVIAKLFQAAGADTSYRLLQLNIGE